MLVPPATFPYEPAGQREAHEAWPPRASNEPAAQGRHAVEPAKGAYVPLAHGAHAVSFARLEPAGQSTQPVVASAYVSLAAHGVQFPPPLTALAVQYGGQRVNAHTEREPT